MPYLYFDVENDARRFAEKIYGFMFGRKNITVEMFMNAFHEYDLETAFKDYSLDWLWADGNDVGVVIGHGHSQGKWSVAFSDPVMPEPLLPIGNELVNHPAHYISKNGLECIDAIEAATEDLGGMDAVCTAQVIKYIWRWKHKNGLQDLEKARWYLKYLIDHNRKDN